MATACVKPVTPAAEKHITDEDGKHHTVVVSNTRIGKVFDYIAEHDRIYRAMWTLSFAIFSTYNVFHSTALELTTSTSENIFNVYCLSVAMWDYFFIYARHPRSGFTLHHFLECDYIFWCLVTQAGSGVGARLMVMEYLSTVSLLVHLSGTCSEMLLFRAAYLGAEIYYTIVFAYPPPLGATLGYFVRGERIYPLKFVLVWTLACIQGMLFLYVLARWLVDNVKAAFGKKQWWAIPYLWRKLTGAASEKDGKKEQ